MFARKSNLNSKLVLAVMLGLANSSVAMAADGQMAFRVIEVQGPNARWAKAGTALNDRAAWKPLKVGDKLVSGTIVQTLIRSSAKLVLEPATPPTIIMLEPMTSASIDEAFRKGDTAVTRLGLGYGAIRGGVAEGGLRSDLEIRSPVATLSKRGTYGFRFYYERGTGRWEMSLAGHGLVEAINNISNQRRLILPGQAVNQAMSRWIQSAVFKPIQLNPYGLLGKDQQFFIENGDGLGILLRGGGNQASLFGQGGLTGFGTQGGSLTDLFQNANDSDAIDRLRLGRTLRDRILLGGMNRGPLNSPDGNFGIGFGGVPFGQGPSMGSKHK